MRQPSRAHWFNRLGSADAARVVCALEAVRQYDWLRITRTDDKRLTLRISAGPHSAEPFVEMSFGAPREDIPSALRTLNRQLSPAIYRRLQANRTFRGCVLLECVRAVLDDDVEMAKGMLSRMGNPSARHLIGILARVARANGVHFTVQLATDRLV